MIRDHSPRPRPATPAAIAAWCGAIVVLLALARPLLGCLGRAVISPFGGIDAVLEAGLLEWSRAHAFSAQWTDIPIFHPVTGDLAYMDSLLGQSLLAAPLHWFGRPTLAAQYNVVWLAALALSGAAMAALWKASGGRARDAGLAALVLLGSPYTLAEIGHLNTMAAPWGILAIAALSGGLAVGAWWTWWATGAALVMQAMWGGYGFAQAGIAVAVISAQWIVLRRSDSRRVPTRHTILRYIAGIVLPLALATAAVTWISQPYRDMGRNTRDYGRTREEVRYYGADASQLLNAGAYRLRPADLLGHGVHGEARYAGADRNVLNPGWVAAALAIFGLAQRRRLDSRMRRTGDGLLLVGVAGMVLAFGESIGVPGTGARLTLPYEWLRDLVPPFRAFRVAWRFSFLAVVAIAWWATAGWLVLARREVGRTARTLAFIALAALVIESLPQALDAYDLGFDGRQRPLHALPPGAVLTLPAPRTEADEDRVETQWLLWALETGRPVTGGVTAWVPAPVRELRAALFRCEVGTAAVDSLFLAARATGVVGAALVTRPDDEDRVEWWRARLRESGAARIDPTQPGPYEVWGW